MKRAREVIKADLKAAKKQRREADDRVICLKEELACEPVRLAKKLGPFWTKELIDDTSIGLAGYQLKQEAGPFGYEEQLTLTIWLKRSNGEFDPKCYATRVIDMVDGSYHSAELQHLKKARACARSGPEEYWKLITMMAADDKFMVDRVCYALLYHELWHA